MSSCYTDYITTMSEITVSINCDTCLAINLQALDIGENDEFIFTLKNYDYIESSYVFLFKACKADINPETGEVIFKIPPRASKMLKPGAFFNFAILQNAYDRKLPTVYKKLTENGRVLLEYGTQDMLVKTGENSEYLEEIVAARLATLDTVVDQNENSKPNTLLSGQLKIIEEA